MTKRQYIYSVIPVTGLTKVGFLKKGATPDEIEKRVCTYFGINSIYQYDNILLKHDTSLVKADVETFSES